MFDAMTGMPRRIASMQHNELASVSDGWTSASQLAKMEYGSSELPANMILSVRAKAFTRRSSAGRNRPSPTRRSRARGLVRTSLCIASIKVACPFRGTKRASMQKVKGSLGIVDEAWRRVKVDRALLSGPSTAFGMT